MDPRDVRISLEIHKPLDPGNNNGSLFDYDENNLENYTELPSFRGVTRNSLINGTSTASIELVPSWQGVTRFLLTIMLRIGFVLVQMGSVPVTNVNLILLQNVVDFGCVTLVYILAGYVIAYGGDRNGLMGEGHWIAHDSADKDEAIIGWQAIAIASAICTSCIVGRTHTVGYLFIGILMAGVLGPFFIHWAWTPKGWMAQVTLHDRNVAFRDYGGSAIIHIFGSLTGLMGCLILGRRILRLRDVDDASVSAGSAGTAFAGFLLILLGLQSACLPSTSENHWKMEGKRMSFIVINNLLGASACSLVVVGLHFFLSRERFNHWTVMRCVQASIAGITILSAGVDVYTPIMCVGLGCSGGIVYYLVSRLVFQSALEDYCNIVATHLTCALVGSFVAPFCRTSTSSTYDIYAILLNVAWQVICLVAIVVLVMVLMTVAFALLECLGLLRNRSEFVNHLRAVVALERGPPRSYMQRLFLPDRETLYLQPGTAPVQRVGSTVSQRFVNHERASGKLENSKIEGHYDTTQRPLAPEIVVANVKPKLITEMRVKKFRQVHTMRSMSESNISGAAGNREAMGDSRNSHVDDDDKKVVKTGVFCSGDVTKDCETEYESLVRKFADLDSGNLESPVEKSIKISHLDDMCHMSPEIVFAISKPKSITEMRIKKFRQVHTMRSMSESNISGAAGNREAMGDSRNSYVDDDHDDDDDEADINVVKTGVFCTGDVTKDSKTEYKSSVRKFADLESGNLESLVEKSIKISHLDDMCHMSPEIVVASSKPKPITEVRVKKFRQVHTMRSMSESNISGAPGNREAMGDSRNSHVDDDHDVDDDDEADINVVKTGVFCTGYVTKDCETEYKSVVQKFADLDSGNLKNPAEKSIKISHLDEMCHMSPEIVVASSKPKPITEMRVKKFRQIHTMRSMSESNISGAAGNTEAMGDNPNSHVVDDDKNVVKTRVFCSGDVTKDCNTEYKTLVRKFADTDNPVEKIIKISHLDDIFHTSSSPESHHRQKTDQLMNMQLEAISEYDENVKVLVKPRLRTFSSTESESDDDMKNIRCQKRAKNVGTSLRRTSKCTDINLRES